MGIKKFIANKGFYGKVFAVMTPILIQNVITNFVSLLDNIMVGQVGTEPMSGVAIVNQFLFVFNLCIFGGLAGAGIFTAQFFGKGDQKGVADTFRAKMYIGLGTVIVFVSVLLLFGDRLIMLFIHEGKEHLDMVATLNYGSRYLKIMLLQTAPFALMQVYASTLRETGETVLPMKAGIAAFFVNLSLNYILIFGKLGAPKLGVEGAAIATVIARFVECLIVVGWAHRHKSKTPYLHGLYSSFKIPGVLAKQIAIMGLPLFINEMLWSGGMAVLNQCYSVRGLEVVSAVNISSTVSNLFFCAFLAMGTTVSIIVGQLLGAGELERAVDEDTKLIALSVVESIVVGLLMIFVAPLFPKIYNTTDTVRHMAGQLLTVSAAFMPVYSFTNACYFTLRSGGKTVITFIFDSLYLWVLCIPLAFVLSRYTELPILPMFIAVQTLDIIKCIIGFFMVKKRLWVKNLVSERAGSKSKL